MKIKKISQKARSVKKIYEDMKKTLEDNSLFLEELGKIAIEGFAETETWNKVEEHTIDYFYETIFVEKFKTIAKYFQDAHNIKLDIRKIKFDKLLYSKDGIEFEERIHEHIKKCESKDYDLVNLLNAYDKILVTETSCLFHGLQEIAFDDEEFVVFEFIGGCDKCTNEFSDGEIYRWDECSEGSGPPYHPNCSCGFVDWIAEEDEKRDLFPEYFPEDEDDFEEEGY